MTAELVCRRTAAHVLGAGMLLAPLVAAGLANGRDTAAWVVQLGAGTALCGILALFTHERYPAGGAKPPGSFPELLDDVLGSAAGRAVRIALVPAFAAGQAAIVWFIIGFAEATLPQDVPGAPSLWWALGLAAAACVGVTLLPRSGAGALRFRPLVAVVVAVAAAVWAQPWSLPTGAAGFWPAASVLFFAGYGWESVVAHSALPGLTRRELLRGVAGAAAVVSTVYLVLVALCHGNRTGGGLPPGGRRLLCGAVACLLLTYCATNLRAVSMTAREVLPQTATRGVAPALVGLAFCFFLLVGRGDVGRLLMVPATAVGAAYALGAVAVLRRGSAPLRWAAAPLLLLFVLLVIAAGRYLLLRR
ncbi:MULTISPECIES: hypothetical protein [Streptacidiphilus]|uniref:Uncharacterized protein n=1 Tax=Streptacidiphilus cavernicola TaxID=3342716 RepID=A0ABV6UX85_9ACTN|nr:hypothetical protein [Streptacidiphilus jeojiense]